MTRDAEVFFVDGCGRCSLGATPDCKIHSWVAPLKRLRTMALQAGLTEGCKWGMPCYMWGDRNVALMFVFKESCGLSFFRGHELQDPGGILEAAGPNTRTGRLFRVTNPGQLDRHEAELRRFLLEALALEMDGVPARPPVDAELQPDVPGWVEFLQSRPDVASAFESLTPGRKRGYLLHFAAAQQASTRLKRMEKYAPQILALRGIHDKPL